MKTRYFAYGANIDPERLGTRVPGARALGPAWLEGHGLSFAGSSRTWGGAVATILPARGERTLGMLYELPPGGLELLDRFEGYPHSYSRKAVIVRFGSGNARAATYFKQGEDFGRPSAAYIAAIEKAYAALGYTIHGPNSRNNFATATRIPDAKRRSAHVPCPNFVQSFEVSRRALEVLSRADIDYAEKKYRACDFGLVDPDVRRQNDASLARGSGHVWGLYFSRGKAEFGVVCDAKDGNALLLLQEEL